MFIGCIYRATESVPYKPMSETWAYDYNADTWVNMQPATEAPFGLNGAGMAYDAESDRMILFGGVDAEAINAGEIKWFDDTWAYDFDSNTWTKMEPAVSPPGRCFYPMAYDAGADRIVLFGADLGETNDMWSYDYNTDTWEELKPGAMPSLRCYCDMVYDAQSDRMILFGGTDYRRETPLADTWAYRLDTNTWTELKPATSPGNRGWYAAVYSTKAGRVILFGGGTTRSTFRNETWIYDPETNVWTNVTPSP
jgi:N-acetylneuraminic acid mutarotase